MRAGTFLLGALASWLGAQAHAQLAISEFFTNPSGTDSPFEWVELVATQPIDFSATPYSVVFSDNSATKFGTSGWITGNDISYGFAIRSGTVAAGDVVYVGGSGMVISGRHLYTLNTLTTPGDGFGIAGNGVLGNGGTVADGIAVFNTDIANVTSALAPIDAIFFGTSQTGSVFLNAYQLPVNDNYSGGKMTTSSLVAPDPNAGTTFATGTFNEQTGTWDVPRVWTAGSVTDGSSSVALIPIPEPSTVMLALLGGMVGLARALRGRWR